MPPDKRQNEVGEYIRLGGSKNPVAFCALHKATLSEKQMKIKECLNKKCWHLKKFDVPYWEQRSKKKAAAKARRQMRKEEIEAMMETRIVTKEQKQKELERGNVYVGETRLSKPVILIDPSSYDEQDVKVRAERAYNPLPLTKEAFKALSADEKSKWLHAMQSKFPHIGQAKYEAMMGFGRNSMQHTFERFHIARTNGKKVPEEELNAWCVFWGKEIEKLGEKMEKALDKVKWGEHEPVNVSVTGTLKGKAKDLWRVIEMLGMSEKEIEVTL